MTGPSVAQQSAETEGRLMPTTGLPTPRAATRTSIGKRRPAVYGHQWRRPILIGLQRCLRARDNAAKAALGSIHAI
jgi:hypothetical protein